MQANGFTIRGRLQHVFRGLRGSCLVTESERVFEKFGNVRLSLEIRGTVSVVLQALGNLVAG